MRYFITGGAGFIGSQVVDKLIEDNGVTVYDNLSSGNLDFIKDHKGKNNFQFIKGDLLNPQLLKESVKDHDFVFHLAANPDIRYGITHTDTDLKQNTIATYNVLEAMRNTNVRKIAFASTSAIYGEPVVMPTPEDYGPLNPISLYGASKLACEALLTSFSTMYGMKSWIFRFANIVGKRLTHGVIYDFINKLKKNNKELEILGDGNQQKSYLYVKDCVEGMLFGIKNSNEVFNVFNLGTKDSIKVKKIAEILVREMKLDDVEFKFSGGERGWPGDVPLMLLDTSKMEKLGWKPKFNSMEAVTNTIRDIVK